MKTPLFNQEAREVTTDTVLNEAVDILTVRGIVWSMIGEVTKYGAEKGKNEKYRQSIINLTTIDIFIENCSKISDHNSQLRKLLINCRKENYRLEKENEQINSQLEAARKAWKDL